ncbi:unnamed protein product [Leptidea sinapis]|uniref:Uncharacterized protein n=1 Tax=Leptidea sinapis TaxID=189913 RepID=A0A5E4R733_9NEOP|nr:unnamed protein product [Leptidea sinapis]
MSVDNPRQQQIINGQQEEMDILLSKMEKNMSKILENKTREMFQEMNQIKDSVNFISNQYGDLKNDLTWSKLPELNYLYPSCCCSLDSIIIDFIEEHELKQFISILNTNERVLDLVLSNTTQINVNNVANPISLVDDHHPPLSISLKSDVVGNIKDRHVEKYNFYKANYDAIFKDLENTPWVDLFACCDNENDMLDIFF